MKFLKGTNITVTDKDGIQTSVDLDIDRELKTGDIFTWQQGKNSAMDLEITSINPVMLTAIEVIWDDTADDFKQNMPCDNYGMSACSPSCKQYFKCQSR